MAVCVVYIPCGSKKEAQKVVSSLLKEKLIACANVFPVLSQYRWKGKVGKSKEVIVFGKTKPALVNKIQARLKSIHSYEVPCILSWAVEANKDFENYVFSETADLF